MLHTDVNRQETVKPRSERAFGLVFAAVFLVIALWPLLERASAHGSPRIWAIAAAGAFALCAWLAPRLLAPLSRLWIRFGELLHRIVSPIALGAIFFGVITPFAVVMRLFKRDALLIRKRSARPSYWVRREPPGPPADSFGNQF
jgi:saxitoxin biosynthesis operon SxtJ-like protein